MGDKAEFAIIGGGIGGLAIAIGLLRAGRSVKVYEAAPEMVEIGAGISLSPNAALAMKHLGLKPVLTEFADCPTKTGYFHYKTGNAIFKADFGLGFQEKYGESYYQLHRADLQLGMVSAINALDPSAIVLDHMATHVEQNDRAVEIEFASGKKASVDFVIGCDGLRSVVRNAVVEPTAPRWTGQVAYRAILSADSVRDNMRDAPTGVYVGPGHIVTRYYMRNSKEINLVAIAQSDAWKEEGWRHPATHDDLLAEHAGWNDDVTALIKAAPADQLYKWALFDRDPLPRWVSGRVALLGDAAHAMLPFLGMGAAMALEDAAILARCVEAIDDVPSALKRYEELRLDRANNTLTVSRDQGGRLQNMNPDDEDWAGKGEDGNVEFQTYGYDPASVAI